MHFDVDFHGLSGSVPNTVLNRSTKVIKFDNVGKKNKYKLRVFNPLTNNSVLKGFVFYSNTVVSFKRYPLKF